MSNQLQVMLMYNYEFLSASREKHFAEIRENFKQIVDYIVTNFCTAFR